MAFGGSGFGGTGFSSTPFGAPSSQPSLFGAPTPTASAPAFGTTATSFGAQPQPSSLFGQPVTATNAFGQPQSASAFGAPVQQTSAPVGADGLPPSTRTAKWGITQVTDANNTSESGKYVAISAMDMYQHFSVEELRYADYARGDKGAENGAQQQTGGGGLFGGSTSSFGAPQSQPSTGFGGGGAGGTFGTATSNLFGATSNATGGLFGQPPAQQSASAYGSASSSSLFGGTGTSAFGATSSSFGAPATAGGGLFGAQPAQSTSAFSGFDSSAAASGSLFGGAAPAGAAASASSFGGGAPAPASSAGLFGATTSAFGAAPSSTPGFGGSGFGTSFGNQGAQSAPSLFGSGQSASGFGMQGAQASSAGGLFGGSFGATASSAGGLFGGSSFGASSSSLFASSGSSLFGGAGQASSAGLFGSSSLFGATQVGGFGAPAGGGLFNSAPGGGLFRGGAQPQSVGTQQVMEGPLMATLTGNPFGESRLITGASSSALSSTTGALVPAGRVGPTGGTPGAGTLSVVVGNASGGLVGSRGSSEAAHGNGSAAEARRVRAGAAVRRGDGHGWFMGSPMRPWGRGGSLFNVGSALSSGRNGGMGGRGGMRGLGRNSRWNNNGNRVYATWRTEEQVQRAANIKKLVIEPMEEEEQEREMRRNSMRKRSGGGGRDRGNQGDEGGRLQATAGDFATPRLAGATVERVSGMEGDENANDENHLNGEENANGQRKKDTPTREERNGRLSGDRCDDGNEKEEQGTGQEGATDGARDASIDIGDDVDKDQVKVVKEKGREAAGEGKAGSDARIVPYSEVYRGQMAAGRRASEGNGALGIGHVVSEVPVSTKAGSYTRPSIARLQEMTSDELSRVEEFTYGIEDVGEITWLEPTDVRGINLDEVVSMVSREVCVYPDSNSIPLEGQGLNKRARVKLHGIWKYDRKTRVPLRDATAAAAIVSRLKRHSDREGLSFLGYDVRTGTWMFEAEHF